MRGFTLLETAVVLSIISILTGLVLTGWPRTRQHQALLLASQQVKTMIHTAQQKALNEDRAKACTDTINPPRLCSDIGIALKDGTIVVFADTVDDNKFTAPVSQNNPGDFELERQTLPLSVTGPSNWQAFIFEATPPHIDLIGGPKTLTLTSGTATKTITVQRYGPVE